MSVYLAIVDEDEEKLAETIDFSAREYSLFQRCLSILLGSKQDPHRAWVSGWNISRVEDDPAGFLVLAMCQNSDTYITPYEAKLILSHMELINFNSQSDEQIMSASEEAFDEKLKREGLNLNNEPYTSWFKRRRDNLVGLLEILANNEAVGVRILIY